MKIQYYLLVLFAGLFAVSCSDPYSDDYVAIDGIYDAELIEEQVFFDALIKYINRSDVEIDALWDGYDWEVVFADVHHSPTHANITIPHQWIYGDTQIWGNGYYENGFLRITYTIEWFGKRWYYTIEGY